MVRFKELLGNPKCHPKFRKKNQTTCIPDEELLKAAKYANITVGSSRNSNYSKNKSKRKKLSAGVTAAKVTATAKKKQNAATKKTACSKNWLST